MAKAVIEMFQAQGMPPGRVPPIQEFTRIYSIMCLIGGACMVVFPSIYPTISIWLLSRPSVQRALVGKNRSPEEHLS